MSTEQQQEMTFMYAPGQVCHTSFHGTDFAALKKFFADGLGWGVLDIAESESPYAVVMDKSGIGVGGLGLIWPGIDWPLVLAYIQVDSLSKARKSITENGGKILGEDVEVPGRGMFAMFEAPGGVLAAAWENSIPIPAGLPPYKHERQVGIIVGRPTATSDPAASMTFFEKVFGWKGEPRDSPTGHKVYIWSDNGGDGGVFFPATDEFPAGMMTPHFLTADIGAATKQAVAAGAKPVGGKQDFGGFAYRQDLAIPGGPKVTLWQDR